jgi:hypothetical protein
MIHWNPYLAFNGQCEAAPRSAGLQRNSRAFRCGARVRHYLQCRVGQIGLN